MNNLPKSWAVYNDGSQLFKNKVIKYLNEINDIFLVQQNLFYGIKKDGVADWSSDSSRFQKILSIDEFIEMTTQSFKRGDRVEMKDDGDQWIERIYIGTIEGATSPFIAVVHGQENEFADGLRFSVTLWQHIRPIQNKVEIEVRVNGKTVSPDTLSEETWNNLRNVRP